MEKIDQLLAQMQSEEEESSEDDQPTDPELEALHGFIKRGEVDIISKKLSDTTNLEYKDPSGRTMLIAAVFYQKADIVDLLADRANKYALDNNAENAVHCAVTAGNIRILRALLEHDHPVNMQDGRGLNSLISDYARTKWRKCSLPGRTPLHVACQLGPKTASQIVPLLLDHGADPELKDGSDFNAMHYAVDGGLDPDLIRQMAVAADKLR